MIRDYNKHIEQLKEIFPDIPETVLRRIIRKYSESMLFYLSQGNSFLLKREKFFLKILSQDEINMTDEYKQYLSKQVVARRKIDKIILQNYV